MGLLRPHSTFLRPFVYTHIKYNTTFFFLYGTSQKCPGPSEEGRHHQVTGPRSGKVSWCPVSSPPRRVGRVGDESLLLRPVFVSRGVDRWCPQGRVLSRTPRVRCGYGGTGSEPLCTSRRSPQRPNPTRSPPVVVECGTTESGSIRFEVGVLSGVGPVPWHNQGTYGDPTHLRPRDSFALPLSGSSFSRSHLHTDVHIHTSIALHVKLRTVLGAITTGHHGGTRTSSVTGLRRRGGCYPVTSVLRANVQGGGVSVGGGRRRVPTGRSPGGVLRRGSGCLPPRWTFGVTTRTPRDVGTLSHK